MQYSIADEIRKLKDLADEGIITQDEFETQKKIILDNNIKDIHHNPATVPAIEELYKVVLNEIPAKAKEATIKMICITNSIGYNEAWAMATNPPTVIRTGMNITQAESLAAKYEQLKCNVSIELDNNAMQVEARRKATISKDMENEDKLRCPKCGSFAITTGARGANFTFVLFGASKTVNRCGKCGYTWNPATGWKV